MLAPMKLDRRVVFSLLPVLALVLSSPAPADEPDAGKAIASADARCHVDETCTVETTIQASKNASGHREYYLDSEQDFHDEKNFAVVISYDHVDRFRKEGIDDPAEHYKGKRLRVTGKVIREHDQVRIRVEDPKQIKLVEESK